MATRRRALSAPAAGPAIATWLVECYRPGMSRAAVDADAARARAAVRQLREAGAPIEYLGALLVAADEVVFHAFRADAFDSVRAASGQAELGFERIVEAIPVGLDVAASGLDIETIRRAVDVAQPRSRARPRAC